MFGLNLRTIAFNARRYYAYMNKTNRMKIKLMYVTLILQLFTTIDL